MLLIRIGIMLFQIPNRIILKGLGKFFKIPEIIIATVGGAIGENQFLVCLHKIFDPLMVYHNHLYDSRTDIAFARFLHDKINLVVSVMVDVGVSWFSKEFQFYI